MSTPFLSEIRIFSFNFAPRGWTLCNGQTLPINQNQALFSLLGTTYGGDGRVTFGLPNLQGRVPNSMGSGYVLGQLSGETAHTLNITEMAQHTHIPAATTSAPSSGSLSGNVWCQNPVNSYATAPNAAMMPSAILPYGGSQPHDNMSPYLTLNFCIALQGIFPSQN